MREDKRADSPASTRVSNEMPFAKGNQKRWISHPIQVLLSPISTLSCQAPGECLTPNQAPDFPMG